MKDLVVQMINNNQKKILPLIKLFNQKIINQDFVIDKTGVKIVEIINFSLQLDPTQPFLDFYGIRKTPKKYIKRQLQWYNSMDLSVKEIGKYAKIWNDIASDQGLINSNYGYLIYSQQNYNQFKSVVKQLNNNKQSRRAVMIYNRPSMQIDYNKNNMSDFICTMYTQHFIRNNKLYTIVSMRSNDFIFGFFNDFYWQSHVHNKLLNELQITIPELENGKMFWNVNSMHLYERHFDIINKINNYKEDNL